MAKKAFTKKTFDRIDAISKDIETLRGLVQAYMCIADSDTEDACEGKAALVKEVKVLKTSISNNAKYLY